MRLIPPNNDLNLPSFTRPEYQEIKEEMLLVWDCWNELKGGKQKYLTQEAKEPSEAYRDRLNRTAFDNRFKPAIAGHAGLLSDFSLTEDTAPSIKEAKNNVDMQGSDLHAFWQECDFLALRDGWCGILVEYPPANPSIQNNADFLQSGRRPYLVAVDRRDILNWHVEYVNGAAVIKRVTICERRLEPDGLFGVKEQTYYRVLVPGTWYLFQIVESNGNWQAVPIEQGVTSLAVVPLVYYSVSETKLFEGLPPFLNLARLNVEHFQKRSQLNEVLRKCNLPVPVRKGLVKSAVDLKNLPPLIIGPNSVLDIPADGDFYFAEPSGSAIAATSSDLAKLEAAMDRVSLAFLVGGEGPQRTATEVVLDSAQTQSSLKLMAQRKASAAEQVFKLWTAYTGEATSGGLNINESILQLPLSPEQVDRIESLATQGFISQQTLLMLLQVGKVLPREFDLEQEVSKTASVKPTPISDLDEVLAV